MKKEYYTPQIILSQVISENIIAASVSSNMNDLYYGGNASDYDIYEADINIDHGWRDLWK